MTIEESTNHLINYLKEIRATENIIYQVVNIVI